MKEYREIAGHIYQAEVTRYGPDTFTDYYPFEALCGHMQGEKSDLPCELCKRLKIMMDLAE